MNQNTTLDEKMVEVEIKMTTILAEISELNQTLDNIRPDTPAGIYNNMIAQYNNNIKTFEQLAEEKHRLLFEYKLLHLSTL